MMSQHQQDIASMHKIVNGQKERIDTGYQIVAILLDALGIFDTPEAEGALDLLCQNWRDSKYLDDDTPFVLPKKMPHRELLIARDETVAASIKEVSRIARLLGETQAKVIAKDDLLIEARDLLKPYLHRWPTDTWQRQQKRQEVLKQIDAHIGAKKEDG